MAELRRGTTPTLWFTTDYDWSDYDVWLTLEEDSVEMTFKDDRLTIDGTDVYVTLTQEETLQFSKRVEIQIKGKNSSGTVVATDVSKMKVTEILNEEVI